MSEIQAKIDEVKATAAEEKAQVAAKLAEQDAKIEELKAAIASGQIDKEAIVAGLESLKVDVSDIYTPEPPAE
jgi:anti-sigma28 factor (negative regulator of flagellin synthesis)